MNRFKITGTLVKDPIPGKSLEEKKERAEAKRSCALYVIPDGQPGTSPLKVYCFDENADICVKEAGEGDWIMAEGYMAFIPTALIVEKIHIRDRESREHEMA